jgi:hypothetical protein
VLTCAVYQEAVVVVGSCCKIVLSALPSLCSGVLNKPEKVMKAAEKETVFESFAKR